MEELDRNRQALLETTIQPDETLVRMGTEETVFTEGMETMAGMEVLGREITEEDALPEPSLVRMDAEEPIGVMVLGRKPPDEDGVPDESH